MPPRLEPQPPHLETQPQKLEPQPPHLEPQPRILEAQTRRDAKVSQSKSKTSKPKRAAAQNVLSVEIRSEIAKVTKEVKKEMQSFWAARKNMFWGGALGWARFAPAQRFKSRKAALESRRQVSHVQNLIFKLLSPTYYCQRRAPCQGAAPKLPQVSLRIPKLGIVNVTSI